MQYLPHHLQDFLRSGLKRETLEKARYESVPEKIIEDGLDDLGRKKKKRLCSHWKVPITNPFNRQTYYDRKKLDEPIIQNKGKANEKETYYVSPPKSIPHLYFSLQITDWKKILDSNEPIYLTEGEKKADKLIQEGYIAVAISGVWCWSKDHHPIDDMDLICTNKRSILLVFDSDYKTKPSVQSALTQLNLCIEEKGCMPVDCCVPPGRGKGIDDYIAMNGIEVWQKYVEEVKEKNKARQSYEQKIEKDALAMLKSPKFMDVFLKECEIFGLVGEINNKVQVYLENCSRLSKEINGGISSKGQAPTAVGKTTLYKIVGKNFFADDFIILTDRSGKLMLWKEKHAWKYKIILTEENHATKATPETESKDYQMRIAKSEGVITYEVLIPNAKEGFVTKKNELEGPFVFQEATTKMYFKDEDINRDTVHNFDESIAQTAYIINFQKNKYGSYNPKLDGLKQFIIDKHKKIQQILKENIPDAIVIPFVDKIKFPEHLHRARRDFPRLVRYIQVSAQVYQFQRKVLTEEEYIKEYSSSIADSESLLKNTLSTIEPSNYKDFESLLIENQEGPHSSKKRILIADERDFELIAKYVVPDLAKEYTQLSKVMADRYDLLYNKFGVSQEFRSMEAGEELGVSDDTARQILYQLEKKGLCNINKESRCYKYQLNAKSVTSKDFGLITLTSSPTTSSTINNDSKPLPILNPIVESALNQQSQYLTSRDSEPEIETKDIELSDDLLERLKELNEFKPDKN